MRDGDVAGREPASFVRTTTAGLEIKLKGEYRTAGLLDRVKGWFDSTNGFLIITPFLPSRSFAGNKALFLTVPEELRKHCVAKKVSAFWLISRWDESASPSHAQPSPADTVDTSRAAPKTAQGCLEYLWMFLQPPSVDNGSWKLAATRVASCYRQRTFVLRESGQREAGLYDGGGARLGMLPTFTIVTQVLKKLLLDRDRLYHKSGSKLESSRSLDVVQPSAFTASSSEAASNLDWTTSPSDDHWSAAVSFYVATPHNNSASMMFNHFGVVSG